MQLSQSEKEEVSRRMVEETQVRHKEEGYIKLRKVRERLPVYPTRERFLETLAKNQVVVLTGETGSGKTTQVCLYSLSHPSFTYSSSLLFYKLDSSVHYGRNDTINARSIV